MFSIPKNIFMSIAISLMLNSLSVGIENSAFVTTDGTNFMLNGKPFRFIGTSLAVMYGPEERANTAVYLQHAAQDGVRVARCWSFGECESRTQSKHQPIESYYFQAGPNIWLEESFIHLDKVLDLAAQNGIKLIMTLSNNWHDYGGMTMYLYWAGVQKEPLTYDYRDEFYQNPKCIQWYKNFITRLITRTNSINGRRYIDDPTIFAWELVNETTVTERHKDWQYQWIKQMTEYIQALDKNHLVSAGMHGYNNPWEREQWRRVCSLPSVDYCDAHFYPTGYGKIKAEQDLRDYIDDRIQLAQYGIKKPMVFGEFGFAKSDMPWLGQDREHWFDVVFDEVERDNGNAALFWIYTGRPDPSHGVSWTAPEDEPIRQVLQKWSEVFAVNPVAKITNPNVGLQWKDSVRFEKEKQHLETFEYNLVKAYTANNDERWLRYDIPVESYTSTYWDYFGYYDGTGDFAHAYGGIRDGYFEYSFILDKPVLPNHILLRARLSSEYSGEPAPKNGFSDVKVYLNKVLIGTMRVIPDNFYGATYEWNLTCGLCFRKLGTLSGIQTLRFEVPKSARYKHGICLYGKALKPEKASESIPIQLTIHY
jgi:mannan endo-1,4-beta-mannosidase